MSRARHKAGGAVKPYNAQGSEVEKEAEERKHGGKVDVKGHGKGSHHRMDRPGRKRGGRAMADKAPLSTASKITPAQGHSTPVDGNASDNEFGPGP
jgi:hypothetical protein